MKESFDPHGGLQIPVGPYRDMDFSSSNPRMGSPFDRSSDVFNGLRTDYINDLEMSSPKDIKKKIRKRVKDRKKIFKFREFVKEGLEDFEETWIDEPDTEIYDDGNIHPYTFVKEPGQGLGRYYYYITDIVINSKGEELVYFYDDPPDISYNSLIKLSELEPLNINDFKVLISGKKKVTNGYDSDDDNYKSYTWDELYKVLTPSYRKFINGKYEDILKDYNKNIYERLEKFGDFEEVWEDEPKEKIYIFNYTSFSILVYSKLYTVLGKMTGGNFYLLDSNMMFTYRFKFSIKPLESSHVGFIKNVDDIKYITPSDNIKRSYSIELIKDKFSNYDLVYLTKDYYKKNKEEIDSLS